MFRLLAFFALLVFGASAHAAPPPPSCTLTPSVTPIQPGGSATLSWTTTNARYVYLNGQARALSGTLSVSPTANTTYTLVAVGRASIGVKQCRTVVAISTDPITIGNIRHLWMLGAHLNDDPNEQMQWMRDNIINVTPITKRPQVSQTMGNRNTMGSEIIAANIKGIVGVGGPLVTYYPTDPATSHPLWNSDIKPFADNAVAWGVKYLYVDEPWASCYGFTNAQRGIPAEIACTVKFWNEVGAYFKSKVPDGKFGLCLAEGDGHGRTLELLRGPPAGNGVPTTGLQADFACLESYGTSNKYTDIFGAIHAEFPNVEKVSLMSGIKSVCQLFDTLNTPTNVTAPPVYPNLTLGVWNLNNYAGYQGQGVDMRWQPDMQEHAQTGERQFCKEPTATFWSIEGVQAGQWRSTDIVAFTYNNKTNWYPQTGITWSPDTATGCAYRVVSIPANGLRVHMPSVQATGVETVPWTTIPCSGDNPLYPDATYKPISGGGTTIKVTVGPGTQCIHNGQMACQVHVRATNSLGRTGWSFLAFNINHPSLSGYNPSP